MKHKPLSVTAKEVLGILRADPQLVLHVLQRQGRREEYPVILRDQRPVRRVHPAIFHELRDHHLLEVVRISLATNEMTWALIDQRLSNRRVA